MFGIKILLPSSGEKIEAAECPLCEGITVLTIY
jgi:hypothetical protein